MTERRWPVTLDETIDTQIEELTRQLTAASDKESLRIRNRLFELRALKKENDTT